jgi:hypothetical protein
MNRALKNNLLWETMSRILIRQLMHFLSELGTKANQGTSDKKTGGIFSRPDMYNKRKATHLLYKNK